MIKARPDSLLPDSPAAPWVNLNSLVGRTFALEQPGREQQFPYAIEEQSVHSWETLCFLEDKQELTGQAVTPICHSFPCKACQQGMYLSTPLYLSPPLTGMWQHQS